jgi:putative transposase
MDLQLRTVILKCELPKDEADELNHASGQVYTQTKNEHYRIYRKHEVWLTAERSEYVLGIYGVQGAEVLHSHSIDAAQQAFYDACKNARAARKAGYATKYPKRNKYYRPTIWKNTGLVLKDHTLKLSRGRKCQRIAVELPPELHHLEVKDVREVRLVWNRVSKTYEWHLVVQDVEPQPCPGNHIAALDLGEVHPVTATDGEEGVVFSCRELRAVKQYTNKRLAGFQADMSKLKKGGVRYQRRQRAKNKFRRKQKQRIRNLEHQISAEVVDWLVEREVGEIAIGDVRDVGDGKRLHRKSQQKVSQWAHGRLVHYITYKAKRHQIEIDDQVNEAYTSQTCPHCQQRHKPQGRVYHCPTCGFVAHRDVVGATNILSKYVTGKVGNLPPPKDTKYRHPFRRASVDPPTRGLS